MKRFIFDEYVKWLETPKRKPLLVHGIRQVGKTWSVREFGKQYFEQVVYINFDKEEVYKDIFRKSKDPSNILFELSVMIGRKINPENTLIFFDEIQECNEALNALKYFAEDETEYYVIGAGSYLGIALSKGASFPVGKVEMIDLYPMTFKEFLVASGEELLAEFIGGVERIEPISEGILARINEWLRKYYIVGGMPEVVSTWVETNDVEAVSKVQRSILNGYYRDFFKYPPVSMVPKIIGIWDSMVAQLTRENKKFKYSEINKGARAREYEGALEWLLAGKYLNKVRGVTKLEDPLKAYVDDGQFKLYFPDIGLLREMAEYKISGDYNNQFMGAIAENFVLQELVANGLGSNYYWSNNRYKMDFVKMINNYIMPLEVKAGSNVKSASMKFLLENRESGVRFSMKNLKRDGKLVNIPLGLVSEMERLCK